MWGVRVLTGRAGLLDGTKLLRWSSFWYRVREGFQEVRIHQINHRYTQILTKSSMKGMGDTDSAAVARHVANLDATLAVYDGILSKQKYLAGDEVTLADLFHLPYGKMASNLGHKDVFDKYTNVKRWWDELENRESWKKVTQK
jgi:glutathione S-transferase